MFTRIVLCLVLFNYVIGEINDFKKYESYDKECQKENDIKIDPVEYNNGLLIGLKNKKYTNEYFSLWVYSEDSTKSYKNFKINPLDYIKRYGYDDNYSITSIKIYQNGKLI